MSYRVNDALIDVGDEWEGFYNISVVLLTHAHFDHIYGLNRVIELNPNVRIYTNETGREMLLNARKNLSFYHETPIVISGPSFIITVKDSEEITIGEWLMTKAIFTPGDKSTCIIWQIAYALFPGDAYIYGFKTFTNLHCGH